MTELQTKGPRKYAILIGIACYNDGDRPVTRRRQDQSGEDMVHDDLKGSINDIMAMESLLVTMEFEKQDITKLLAPPKENHQAPEFLKPTYDNIRQTFETVRVNAEDGDIVYIHYSGHGARATTVFSGLKKDENKSGLVLDEVLVPVDVTSGGNYIRDLELALWVQKMVDAGLIVTMVLDCCYSGGAMRGEKGGIVRGSPTTYYSSLEDDVPQSIEEIKKRSEVMGWLENPKGFVLLAACQKFQKAAEMDKGGKHHGVLSYYLHQALHDIPEQVSAQELHNEVYNGMLQSGLPQAPHLVGDTDRLFFGRGLLRQELTVTSVDMDRGNRLSCSYVYLLGSDLIGVLPGSIYIILPAGFDITQPINEADILARAKTVHKVEIREMQAVVTYIKSGCRNEVRQGCHAILERLPLEHKFSVKLSQRAAEKVPNFRKLWDENKGNDCRLRLNDNGQPIFTVDLDNDMKNFALQDSDRDFVPELLRTLDKLPLSDVSTSIRKLIRRIDHLARFKIVKGIQNQATESSLRLGASVKPELWPEGLKSIDKYETKATALNMNNEVWEFMEGEAFVFKVQNNSQKDVGFALLYLSPEIGIEQSYPQSEPWKTIAPGDVHYIQTAMRIDDRLRSVANEWGSTEGTLKFFITTPAVSFHALRLDRLQDLEGGAFRGSDDQTNKSNELERLLRGLRSPLRGPDCYDPNIGDWQTVSFRVRTICKSPE